MKRVWYRREPYDANEVWDLFITSDPAVIVGSVQVFPNGSTCYWFEQGQVGKPGPFYGNRCDAVSRARDEAFAIVESHTKKFDPFARRAFEPITKRDAELLSGEPKPLKVIVDVKIEESDFYYECTICKTKIPANYKDSPNDVNYTIERKGPTSITSFYCEKCFRK